MLAQTNLQPPADMSRWTPDVVLYVILMTIAALTTLAVALKALWNSTSAKEASTTAASTANQAASTATQANVTATEAKAKVETQQGSLDRMAQGLHMTQQKQVDLAAAMTPPPNGTHGISHPNSLTQTPPIIMILMGLGILLMTMTGCASGPVAPGEDPVLVNLERGFITARETLNEFVEFEYANQAFIKEALPEVHRWTDEKKPEIRRLLLETDAVIKLYREFRLPETADRAKSKLDLLQDYVTRARDYLMRVQAAKAGRPTTRTSRREELPWQPRWSQSYYLISSTGPSGHIRPIAISSSARTPSPRSRSLSTTNA